MPVVTHPHTLLSYTRNGVPSLILPLEHPSELWHLIRARYYEPSTGRFITQDPYKGDKKDPASFNLYVYCRNNPIKSVDPSGLKDYVFYNDSFGEGGMHELIAKTLAKKYKCCKPIRISCFEDLSKYIDEPIDHLIIVAHGTLEGDICFNESSDMSNLTLKNAHDLAGKVTFNYKGFETQIEIYACNSANIAAELCLIFGVNTMGLGSTGGYSPTPSGSPNRKWAAKVTMEYEGPVYMVPESELRGDFIYYTPNAHPPGQYLPGFTPLPLIYQGPLNR